MLRTAAAVLFLIFCLPLARAQTIVCFGDSLTAGYGALMGESYPDFLRKDLKSAGYHVTILNQGVSGATTKDGLERFSAVLRAHPAIVILELGANDGLRGEPVNGTTRNLSYMIQRLQLHHIRVLLAGIYVPPNLGPEYVRQFDAMYPALATKYHVPLIPFLLQGVFGVPGLMSEDYLHPDGAGYAKVAQTVLRYLEPMLRK